VGASIVDEIEEEDADEDEDGEDESISSALRNVDDADRADRDLRRVACRFVDEVDEDDAISAEINFD
jgi:hypothetical protein